MKSMTVLLTALFLLPCPAGAVLAGAETGQEPLIEGKYYRMIFEGAGRTDNWPTEKVVESYAEMAQTGFDGTMTLIYGAKADRYAERHGMTPDAYHRLVVDLHNKHGLRLWPDFSWTWFGMLEAENLPKVMPEFRDWVARFKDVKCFRGIAFNEPSVRPCYTRAFLDKFKESLVAKYSTEQLADMGLAKLADPRARLYAPPPPRRGGRPAAEAPEKPGPFDFVMPKVYEDQPVLHTEYELYLAGHFAEMMARMDREVGRQHPGTGIFPVISFMNIIGRPFRSSVAQMGRVCSAISVDSYWDGASEESFWAKIMRNQARGPSFLTITIGKYSSGPRRFAREVAVCLTHSPAIKIWAWVYARPDPPTVVGNRRNYIPENRTVLLEGLRRAEKLNEYLAPSSSTARVGLVYSERVSMWSQSDPAWSKPGEYVANCYGLHSAFAQLGIQYEPFFEQLLSTSDLSRFRVMVLPETTYLSPESLKALQAWVERGGTLIALGAVGCADRWGRPGRQSEFESLMGARYQAVTGAGFTLDAGAHNGIEVRYNASWSKMVHQYGGRLETAPRELPAWSYETTTARTTGTWSDKSPAVIERILSKGRIIGVGAQRMGVCYEGTAERRRENRIPKTYFNGVLDGLQALIDEGLGDVKAELPLQSSRHPKQTEITVRAQPGRYVVHLINFDTKLAAVKDAEVTIRVPAGKEAVAYYPLDMSRARFRVRDRDVKIAVREFDLHEFLVVQYEGHLPAIEAPRPAPRFFRGP